MASCTACGAALPEAARFCPACGARVEVVAATTERKLVSVLFADLVGSTAFASDEDPERVRAVLDDFYDAMAIEAVAAGGTVEKFAGDAVLAAFGAAAAQEDHAERALHAALAMRRRFAELFGGRLALRIGVATGEVAVGPARVGGSFLSGDVVNVAARLEQHAPPGEILASERTVAAARGAFEFGEQGVIEAKGKEDGIPSRRLVRALSLQRPRGVAGLRAAFVGRESELELLRVTFRRAANRREPHLVTIVGEPGVGKTRLVRELWQLLAAEEPAPLRRTGRCLSYGDGITYWPVAEVVKEHFGILESDPPEKVLERLGERQMLGLALGLDLSDSHPLDTRERLHAAVVDLFDDLAQDRPTVVLIEDVHWAEDDLLELLDRIVREGRGPLLLLATARPELVGRRPQWGGVRRNAATIWLEPLNPYETELLINELLALELPEAVLETLVERAEGNPFFVEELLGALVDAGVLRHRDGRLQVGDVPEALLVPDSVYAVLAARIDRLPAREKAGLQAAAVVGRVFWTGPVKHLLGGEEPDFDLLEARDFVRRRAASSMAGEREFAIKHALTREVAYTSIPKAKRGRLHAAFAGWLDEAGPAKDEHASLVAYHYSEAVRPEDADLAWGDDPEELAQLRAKAVSWLRRAGGLARGRYEIDEAIELLTRATELVDDPSERSALWREIGLCHALEYDGEAFRTAMERSLELCTDRATCGETYSLLAYHTSIRSGMWRSRPRRRMLEEWIAKALELSEGRSLPYARALLARAETSPSDVADDVLERASALAEELDDVELRSDVLMARSDVAFERTRFGEAATWTERRLELLAEIDDPDHHCLGFESGVSVMTAIGRIDEARRLAARHGELARRLSPHHRMHAISLELEIADALGEWPTIAGATDRVADAVRENLATPCSRNARDLLLCALAHLCLGDEAKTKALEAEAAAVEGEGYGRALASPRLQIALVRGDREAVEVLVQRPPVRAFAWGPAVFASRLDAFVALGRREAIEHEAPPLAEPDTLVEPFALRALGFARRDDDLLARADRRFAALGLDWHRSQTARLLAWPSE